MRSYFVDAWFFIAFANRFDVHHSATQRLIRAYSPSSFITHDGVLSEVLAYFSAYGRDVRARAAKMVRDTIDEYDEVLALNRELFVAGLSLYEHRLDKEYSLTDCISMTVMRDRGITHILTNDHHFRQEGFIVLSDAP